MNLVLIFTTAFIVCFSGALIPGPMLSITIKESLEQGWPAGFLIVGGHAIAEVTLIGLFFLGLNTPSVSQWVSAIVGIAGGTVLLLMGFQTARDGLYGRVSLDLQESITRKKEESSTCYLRPLREGLIVSVANPTWILWWLSVGAFYVTEASHYGWLGLSSFYSGHILADLSWFGFVSFAVATGKKFFNPKIYRAVLVGCGIFLLGIAFFFMGSGLRHFFHLFT
ncbi:MAG TPA: lysine transporter LysE [Peptococcaceae bacterium]|nr:lysine transporter LysE [Peptococcaceae bacterium]